MSSEKVSVVVPGAPLGWTTAERLEEVAAAARKYGAESIKLTASQRMNIYGVNTDDAASLAEELGGALPKPVGVKTGAHTVQACPSTKTCKYARQDAIELAEKLREMMSTEVYPGKVKVGVSGCGINCCESWLRDVGVFGKKSGWTLIVGGNAAGRPRIGDVIGEDLTDDEVVAMTRKALAYYAENAKKMERSARLFQRKGIEELQELLK